MIGDRLREQPSPAAPERADDGAGGSRAREYDAFISYSHAVDNRLAPSLQAGLHSFAKPWYRLRALRIFRDETSLSASPGLWSSIEAALEASRWFVLLASPEAAGSAWVGKEVAFWRERRTPERILIVLTDGDLLWDEGARDFDTERTTALPPALRGAFAEEPRFVDLRWARSAEDVSLSHPGFRDAVADVAARLHDRPKDELLGEDVRQHRRTRRIARAVVIALATLLAATAVAAVIALQQRETAVAERDRAEEQARIALARQLAAEAIAAPADRLDVALLLAVESHARQQTSESRSALLQALLRSPHLVGFVPGLAGASDLDLSADGSLLAAATGGAVSLWDTRARRRLSDLEPPHAAPVTRLALSADGTRVASIAEDGTIGVWETETGERLAAYALTGRGAGVALDAAGERVAAAAEDGPLTIWRVGAGEPERVLEGEVLGATDIAFVGAELVAADGQGRVERWTLAGGEPERRFEWLSGGMPLVSDYPDDMSLFSGVPLGQGRPYLIDARRNEFLHDGDLEGPVLLTDTMAFDPGGTVLATAGEGQVVLWDVGLLRALDDRLAGVPGTASALAVADGAGAVVAGGGRAAAVWDLGRTALVQTVRAEGAASLDAVPRVLHGSGSAAFSRDGRLIAWWLLTVDRSDVVVWDLERDEEAARFTDLANDVGAVAGFDPDGRRLAVTSFDDQAILLDLETGERERVAEIPWQVEPAGTTDPSGSTPWKTTDGKGLGASVAADGRVTLWDVERRRPLGSLPIPGAFDHSFLAFGPTGRRLAVATAGGALSLVDVDTESWIRQACSLAARPLTDAEWRLHIGTEPGTRSCP